MSQIRGWLPRRVVEVASGPETPDELLESVGLSPSADASDALAESIAAEDFYDLIERAAGPGDHGLPFRYATAFRLEDLGALGLAIKTASDLRAALRRLVRYTLVLTDSLDYELLAEGPLSVLVLTRPHHRRGAELANECALAAVVSALRQTRGSEVSPAEVWFQHAAPDSTAEHWAYFRCPVRFGAPKNALRFDEETMATPARLADEGLSTFLLADLDQRQLALSEPSVVARVHRTVVDSLPEGLATKSDVARRLGMSERTLHRRLGEEGESFRSIINRARREAAESLLARDRHSIAEIAFLTGFGDQSAFQRAFKGWTGQTPLAFREMASGRLDG